MFGQLNLKMMNQERTEQKMRQNRLSKSGGYLLNEAYKSSKGLGRARAKELKRESKLIFSERSLKANLSAWEQFSAWASEQGVKNLNKVTPELVTEFLTEKAQSGGRDGKGATAKTLKGYLGAINKVMEVSGQWSNSDRMSLSESAIEVRSDYKQGYKPLTASEWRERHSESAERHSALFDTISAFGLRSAEVQKLNEHSIVECKGKLYVQTIGKGGKFRIAECRNDMQGRMRELHAKHIKQVQNLSSLTEKRCLRDMKDESKRLNIYGAKSHKLPKHIFRAEYAQGLLKEKLAEATKWGGVHGFKPYSDLDKLPKSEWRNYTTRIGTWQGNAEAFLTVSKALGHNRLDVLLRYI